MTVWQLFVGLVVFVSLGLLDSGKKKKQRRSYEVNTMQRIIDHLFNKVCEEVACRMGLGDNELSVQKLQKQAICFKEEIAERYHAGN